MEICRIELMASQRNNIPLTSPHMFQDTKGEGSTNRLFVWGVAYLTTSRTALSYASGDLFMVAPRFPSYFCIIKSACE